MSQTDTYPLPTSPIPTNPDLPGQPAAETGPPLQRTVGLPLAEAFFTSAVSSHSLAHGYILKGKALGKMYNLALQIAKIVNCQNPTAGGMPVSQATGLEAGLAALACGQCTDCRWIERNAHPAVLTISRLTYQVSDKGEDLSPDDLEKLAKKGGHPTQIKAEQVDRLLSQLGLSTEHTRVIIFTDAEAMPAAIPSEAVAPFEWRNVEANEDKSFHIRPLERRLFNHASANRFLKTLEEPPPRTLFFFLAETEAQILETIVSRCQVVPCQTGSGLEGYLAVPDVYRAFLQEFLHTLARNGDIYRASADFERFFIDEQGLTPVQALDVMQLYLRDFFLQRTGIGQPLATASSAVSVGADAPGNNGSAPLPEQVFIDAAGDLAAFPAYRTLQESLMTARRMLDAKVNEGQALANLFLSMVQPLQSLIL